MDIEMQKGFNVLLVLNGMYVFEEHIKKVLGNDIKEKLMRYVMFGEPLLDAHDMTEKLRDYLVESLYYKIDETFLNQLETVLQDELLTRLQIIREKSHLNSQQPAIDWEDAGNYETSDQGKGSLPNAIADPNPGPSTSSYKYERLQEWSSWPRTVDEFMAEAENFMLYLAKRTFYFVTQEEPKQKRKYERQVNVDERRVGEEAYLKGLLGKESKEQCTSAEKQEIAELRKKVKQNDNTKGHRKGTEKEFNRRLELYKALREETDAYVETAQSASQWVQALPLCLLRSKLDKTVNAILDFTTNGVENKDTHVRGNVTKNKYQQQLTSWDGERAILSDLKHLLARLILISQMQRPVDGVARAVSMNSLKRESHPHENEPAIKKPAPEMKKNSLLVNVRFSEKTTNEDEWLEPNHFPGALTSYQEPGGMPEGNHQRELLEEDNEPGAVYINTPLEEMEQAGELNVVVDKDLEDNSASSSWNRLFPDDDDSEKELEDDQQYGSHRFPAGGNNLDDQLFEPLWPD